jgi:hypothetical protein
MLYYSKKFHWNNIVLAKLFTHLSYIPNLTQKERKKENHPSEVHHAWVGDTNVRITMLGIIFICILKKNLIWELRILRTDINLIGRIQRITSNSIGWKSLSFYKNLKFIYIYIFLIRRTSKNDLYVRINSHKNFWFRRCES